MMAGIRNSNTKPELLVRRFLHRQGLRFRLHVAALPGRPDIVLPRWCAVVQVHGCFWHRHSGCRYATTPATNPRFWLSKLEGNADRDRRTNRQLRAAGWRVFTIWECQAQSPRVLDRLALAVRDRDLTSLRSTDPSRRSRGSPRKLARAGKS
jgi:DNA mismatch endonuclease (patch repair protein)